MARQKVTARKATAGKTPRFLAPHQKRQPVKNVEILSLEGSGEDEDGDGDMDESEASLGDEEKMDTDNGLSNNAGSQEVEFVEELLDDYTFPDYTFQISPSKSVGGQFDDDLQDCLSGSLEVSSGTCYFEHLPAAPNPWLNIEGLGCIGIPVGSRDAVAVSELAATLANPEPPTPGRNVYSISPSKVTFSNSQWTEYMRQKIAGTVWTGAAIAPYLAPAQCALRRAVIMGPGPINLDDICKDDDGNFAYVVVQLPSPHAGGQAQVVHNSQTRKIDLTEKPYITSVLAFYKGADISFLPITEGYRVSLVYTLATKRSPELSAEAPVTLKLRRVFKRWTSKKGYRKAPSKQQLVYILDPRKTPLRQNRKRKTPKLSPKDKETISCLQAVAREFGYAVFSGELTYHEQGGSDQGPPRYTWDREDDDYDDYNVDTMTLDDVEEIEVSFADVVGADGVAVTGATVDLDVDNIVPTGFFSGLLPDEKDFDFDSKMMNYYYYRKAILVVPKETEVEVLTFAKGSYWLSRLEALDPEGPEPLDARKADKVLSYIKKDCSPKWEPGPRLMKLALKWKDFNLWSKTAQKLDKAIDAHKLEDIFEAWDVFSFEPLAPVLDAMLLAAPSMKRLEYIKKLESHTSAQEQEAVANWVTEQYTKALTSVRPPELHSISDILAVGRERGAAFLAKILVPHFAAHPPDIEFMDQLCQQLRQNDSTIAHSVTPPANTDEPQMTASLLASECLHTVLDQPAYKIFGMTSSSTISSKDQPAIFSKVKTTIKQYLALENSDDKCALPLRLLLHIDLKGYRDFSHLYDELISDIRGWLEQNQQKITALPFKHFFAAVIGMRLESLLHSPQLNIGAWKTRADSAKQYLKSIGSDDEVAALMEDDYAKIQEALQGKSAYISSPRFKNALGEITRERLGLPKALPPHRRMESAFGGRLNLGKPTAMDAYREKHTKRKLGTGVGKFDGQLSKRARGT